MIDIDELDDHTREDILDNLCMDSDEPTVAELTDLACSSAHEAMDRFLNWNGIIGYTETIITAIDSIRIAETVAQIREFAIKDNVRAIYEHLAKTGHRDNPMLKLLQALAVGILRGDKSLIEIREVFGGIPEKD